MPSHHLDSNGNMAPGQRPRVLRGPERPGRHLEPARRARGTAAYQRIRADVLAMARLEGQPCALCGKPERTEDPFTVDHVTPVSHGGHPTHPSNLRVAHRSCNSRRGNRAAAS